LGWEAVSVVVDIVEERFQVSPAIENAIDRDGRGGDMKGDGDAAPEGRGPQARPEVLVARV
jgi:hypothetical protein